MSAKIPIKDTASAKSHAKPGKDTIYVDVEDEITAIIDKVEGAKQKVVALVLPKRATTLQSTVNMRLLKRSATNAGKNVVLITNESALLPLAGAAGLHIAKNLQSKPGIPPHPHGLVINTDSATPSDDTEESLDEEMPQKLDYNQPIGELASSDEESEAIALDDEDGPKEEAVAAPKKMSKKKGLKVPNFDRFRMLITFGGVGVVALILLLVFAIVVLPKAKITIKTASTQVSADFNLTASGKAKQLDEEKGIIPSVLEKSNQTESQEVNATGQKNLGKKASGSVKISTSNFSICAPNAQSISIPAGTGVSTDGQTYITEESMFLGRQGGSCQLEGTSNITAQDPGSKYNVSGASFSVAGHSDDVTATGSASGGTDKNVTVVTQQDVDGAKQKITSADSDKFSRDFQKDLEEEDFYVFTSTLKIGEATVSASPSVGEEADKASVQIKITYSVLVVKKTDLEKAVKKALEGELDKNKQELSEEDILANLNINVQGQSGANATLEISKEATAVAIIDKEDVKNRAKGKKPSIIKSELESYPGVESVDVNLSPLWVSSIPGKTGKITVVIEPVKQDQ